MDLSGSIGVAQQLEQIDVGRFAVLLKCINREFAVGDDVTLTDGSFHVLQEHCPVLQIQGMKGAPVQSSEELDDDLFWVILAFWFPPGTAFNSLHIVKESEPPAFVPMKMPERVVLGGKEKEQETAEKGEEKKEKPKGLLQRLFGRK